MHPVAKNLKRAYRDRLRAALPDTGGATLLHPDVLYLRLLAADSFEMRKTLLPILDRLTGDGLPLAWRL